MLINLIWDTRAQAAPQSFRDGIQAAATLLDNTFIDNITVNISVGYGEINGQSEPSTGASAGPASLILDSYSQVRTWLTQHAAAEVQAGVAAMPAGTSIQGQSQVAVWRAQERLMGQVPASDGVLDGVSGFGTGIATNLLEGVALHELTHAMGRVPYTGVQPDIFDLYRFSAPGTYLFGNAQPPAAASYFSLDGGITDLADYGRTSDPSDFLNSSGRTPNDPFNEFYNAATTQALTHIDILQMEALGFHVAPPPPPTPPSPLIPPNTPQVHANDLTYAATASGSNHFIDYLNFEASYSDLIRAFGTDQQAMQAWYSANEPREQRVETFDGLDYIASYGDLISAFRGAGSMHAVQDAGATHFIANGLNEGRTTTFNGLDYIASYGDLIAAFRANSDAGAYHYIMNGQQEGRATSFDGLSYIANYTDLMSAFGANEQAGAAHYIAYGSHEGRTTSFDVAGYLTAHPDLQGHYSTTDQFLTAYINTYTTTGHFLT
jgi:hypothetical protein